MADGQRASRVGGYELDLDPLPGSELRSRVGLFACSDDVHERVVQPRGRKLEIDKPGPRGLDRDYLVDLCVLERGHESRGNVARRPTDGLRDDECSVGRPVTMLRARRADELDLLRLDWDMKGRKSRDDPIGQASFGGHLSPRMAEVPLACNLRSSEPS